MMIADDEAASGAPEHLLSGNAQTSRRRLAMTHRNGRNINAKPARGFSRGHGRFPFSEKPGRADIFVV